MRCCRRQPATPTPTPTAPDRQLWRSRVGDALGAGAAGAAVVLIPKCPACVVAWAGLVGGVSLPFSAAGHVRVLLLTVCLASLLFIAWRIVRREILS